MYVYVQNLVFTEILDLQLR